MRKGITSVRKEMEYEDAPSGAVLLYNYKEPFMPYEDGFGFEGVLLFDATSDKVQCHICGEWFSGLGTHIYRNHKLTAADYKLKVGLSNSTALIGEKMREKLIVNGMKKRMKNLRPGKKKTQQEKDRISATLKKVSRERQNVNGTCPAQLIDRLRAKYAELGRTPTQDEVGCYETIFKVWGSYKNACSIAGIPYRKPGSTIDKVKDVRYTKEIVVAWVAKYLVINKGKLPDYKKKLGMYEFARTKLGGWKNVCKEAAVLSGLYKGVDKIEYTKSELVDFLRMFEKHHGRKPSQSDCNRGLLPPIGLFTTAFGSWKNAALEARV